MVVCNLHRALLLNALLELFEVPLSSGPSEEPDVIGDLEETGYQPSYTKLAMTGRKKKEISVDADVYLVTSLQGLLQSQPGLVDVMKGLPGNAGNVLMEKMQGGASLR